MPFTIFQKFTTVSADEINDNFYHVGQGDLIPKGGTSLADTTSVYDLGSSDYRWNNLYCNNINIDGSITTQSKSLWTLEAEVNVTATASTITISGLNGDSAEIYRIIGKIVSLQTTTIIYHLLYINGDSSASYGLQYLYSVDNTVYAAREISFTAVFVGIFGVTSASDLVKYTLDIYSKVGNERLILNDSLLAAGGTFIYGMYNQSYIWNNTTDTITSLIFRNQTINSILPGTHIEVWKRG